MRISSFKYYTIDAFKSLKRNLTISTASVATVAATLFILGVFLVTMMNIRMGISNIESTVEIKVFLKDDITLTDKRDIEVALRDMDEVREVIYESKEEALNKFREQLSQKDRFLLNGYDGKKNPLPSSFIVKLANPELAETVVSKIQDKNGIDSIGNDRELIQNIISISKAIKWIGLVIFVALIGVSLFLIGNTIRLTVFSRRREIGIMKFVGATDWFIRWPFIIEGMIIGIAGALVAILILYYAYRFAFVNITENLMAVQLVSPSYVFGAVLWQFLAAGAVIGSIGSVIALRKFLVV